MNPSFLIVGAMKAGTTTLYRDLSLHPDTFLPGDKEPNILINYESSDDVVDEYAKLFRNSFLGQLCGEASTSYTKAPKYTRVPEKALDILGDQLKIIYMRRDPIERAISQYKHELQHGTIDVPFEVAIKKVPRFIDYSRYDWQISPWIECFGSANVMQIELERYSVSRCDTLNEVLLFLGLSVEKMPSIDIDHIANSASEAKTIRNPILRAFVYSDLYQRKLKMLMSDAIRAKLRNTILPKPKSNIIEPSEGLKAYILDELNNSQRLS